MNKINRDITSKEKYFASNEIKIQNYQGNKIYQFFYVIAKRIVGGQKVNNEGNLLKKTICRSLIYKIHKLKRGMQAF